MFPCHFPARALFVRAYVCVSEGGREMAGLLLGLLLGLLTALKNKVRRR